MPQGQFKSTANMGRPKGSINKRSQDLVELIEEACPGFNPVVSMARIAHLGTINTFINVDGEFRWVETPIAPEHRVKCLTEVCQYVAAKRKAIEHSGGIATTGGVLLVDKVADPEAWLAHTSAPMVAATSAE